MRTRVQVPGQIIDLKHVRWLVEGKATTNENHHIFYSEKWKMTHTNYRIISDNPPYIFSSNFDELRKWPKNAEIRGKFPSLWTPRQQGLLCRFRFSSRLFRRPCYQKKRKATCAITKCHMAAANEALLGVNSNKRHDLETATWEPRTGDERHTTPAK